MSQQATHRAETKRRDARVLELHAQGVRNVDIARRTGISQHYVSGIVTRMKRKAIK
jgi:DNA-binding CsgD family transcriptional regulator